ncbi:hypothetical protein [Candidatus Poriferisodalis sp.]|uniref:glycoside hydrolase family 38 N-terminal domain-containing protein n=1 Tax=Candidatus Poriferisodalis sp. TaxID=3101277 RepID=UPI003B01113C
MVPTTPASSDAVHIINHTHWDREWFLTEEYTTPWLPELIDAIDELHAANPGFRYLLDGQTLAIEDLLRTRPQYEDAVGRLVSGGVLSIGPFYSQPDWRITGGELLVRNLRLGLADANRHGGRAATAWLVDTFGHISQAPQLLVMAGITTAYVWRGVPQLEPLLRWTSPDGTSVAAINLFGGYRNLYGISRTESLATRRLRGEYDKLAEYYSGLPIPLFDGYDLETAPEDPVAIYRELDDGLGAIHVIESSPEQYARAVDRHVGTAPEIVGELLSGKYGSTFPGTLSARTYLKLMHADVEHLLHRVCEPLATLAAVCDAPYRSELYDAWDRELLRNAIHDCICGVSVDPVHERMERSYRRLLHEMARDAEHSARWVARRMRDGRYVLSTTPMPRAGSVRTDGTVFEFDSNGLGLAPLTPHSAHADTPLLKDEAVVGPFGPVEIARGCTVDLGGVVVGPLEVRRDSGDAYSSEPGELLGVARITYAEIDSASDLDMVLLLHLASDWSDGELAATMRVRLSRSRTVELDIDLDSSGSDFIAELVFDPCSTGAVLAGMPFDTVERQPADRDLLGHEIEAGLARVLMGQREVDEVTTFPFQDFVAAFDGERSVVVHARGLRAYRMTRDGAFALTLRRSVEWLAKTGLRGRAGDAGPSMYVPGARCERLTRLELGVSVIDAAPDSAEFVAACDSFRNPPIVVEIAGSHGTSTRWEPVQSALPMSALWLDDGESMARFYNPTTAEASLEGTVVGPGLVGPGRIVEQRLRVQSPRPEPYRSASPTVKLHGLGADRGGRSRSMPDEQIVTALDERAAQLSAEAAEVRASLAGLGGNQYHLAVHQALVCERESHELALSAAFNRRRLDHPEAEVSLPDTEVQNIAELGRSLNELRIRRRIYDYVAELISHQAGATSGPHPPQQA